MKGREVSRDWVGGEGGESDRQGAWDGVRFSLCVLVMCPRYGRVGAGVGVGV